MESAKANGEHEGLAFVEWRVVPCLIPPSWGVRYGDFKEGLEFCVWERYDSFIYHAHGVTPVA